MHIRSLGLQLPSTLLILSYHPGEFLGNYRNTVHLFTFPEKRIFLYE
ncbi:MAG: hypothetical protein ACON4O_03875 [Lentimonas sp.]